MYNILDVLGDLGGIVEIIMIIFGFLLYPVSEHSFYLRASRMLFFARTKEEKIFEKNNNPDEEDKLEKYMDVSEFADGSNSKLVSEIKKHHIIRLSMCDNVKLFIANIINRFCCSCCWNKKKKL